MQEALSALGLRAGGFDHDTLKAAYRRESLRIHPDKGGSDAEFDKLTLCYKRLKKFLKDTGAPPPSHEQARTQFVESALSTTAVGPTGGNMSNAAFNAKFEKEHLLRPEGHGEWFSGDIPEDRVCPESVPFKDFNRAFTQMAKRNTLSLIVHTVPTFPTAGCTLGVGSMAGERSDDYGSSVTGCNKLTYSDLRIAHDQQIIDVDEAAAFAARKAPEYEKRLVAAGLSNGAGRAAGTGKKVSMKGKT
jgi:hypothetical protein